MSAAINNKARKINFTRIFRQLAQRYGDRPALLNTERNREYSYRELHALTNKIANMMAGTLKLQDGDRYLYILRNDNLSLLHFWTILKGPAAAVFSNVNDSLDEHFRQIDFVKPKCVFLESDRLEEFYAPLTQRGIDIVAMDGVPPAFKGVHDFWPLVTAASDHEPVVEFEADSHPVFYRFTGGTTGIPKCATYAYRHVEFVYDTFLRLEDRPFTGETRFLHFTPLSHGTILAAIPTFFVGGCNLTQNEPDLVDWLDNVERGRVTGSFMVPTLLYRLLALDKTQQCDLSSLSSLLYGAAPMSPAKLGELQAQFGNIFYQGYGATESFGIVSCLSKADHAGSDIAGKLQSCGRATPGVELMIADDDGCELPVGGTGELWHRHRGIISGYYNNPEVTAAEFTDDGWWKSGDLARINEDGYITIVDRKKDMIISGGFNIYATEVESALCSHPAVLMCAVVGVPHADWGEAVHAEVIPRCGARVDADELIAHVKRAIGNYKAPKSIVFVDELPMSSVGKVLRKEVRSKYWRGSARQVS